MLTEDPGEVGETVVDVLDACFAAPVALGGEVDYEAWAAQLGCLEDEHVPGLELVVAAGSLVGAVVLGQAAELQGDALAHDADGVDRVDERLSV